MFNRKKKRIAELLRENEQLWQEQKQDLARIHQLCEEAKKKQIDVDVLTETLRDTTAERNDLQAKLDKQKEISKEWIDQHEKDMKTIEELKRKAKNAEWREKHYRAAHGSEQSRPVCPADCSRHANPGPGGSVCRNCTRNPRAVDKYTTETI